MIVCVDLVCAFSRSQASSRTPPTNAFRTVFKDSILKNLGVDYVDIYLVHWPVSHLSLPTPTGYPTDWWTVDSRFPRFPSARTETT